MNLRYAILLSTLWLAACEQQQTTRAPSTQSGQPAAATTGPSPADDPTAQTAPVLESSVIQSILDAWLKAQESGDFEAYAALYATKFEGIKRVGPRMYRFDRETWLADRARMFKKTITLSVDEVEITATADAAVVSFQQTWASGTFKDIGPKQLFVTKTADGLRISKEEMLKSTLATEGEVPSYDPQAFMLLVAGRVVLDVAPKDDMAVGPPSLLARPNPMETMGIATRNVDAPKSGFGGWIGRELELFDASNRICKAKIDGIELITRAEPYHDAILEWEGTDDRRRASDAVVANGIWDFGARARFARSLQLVGTMPYDHACEGALWARPVGSTAQPLASGSLGGPRERELVGSYTDLPAYHTRQADFDAAGHKGAWHDSDASVKHFARFGEWVVTSTATSYGCDGFEAALTSIWRTSLGGFVAEAEEVDVSWLFDPVAAIRNGENVYFITKERVVSNHGGRWGLTWETTPAIWQCGC